MKKLLIPTLLIITIAIATGLYSQKFKDLDAMQHQTPVIESPSTPPVEEKKNDTPSNQDQSDQDPSNTSGNTSEDEDYTTITPGEYVPQDRPQSEVLIQKNIDFVEVFNLRDGYNFKLDVRKYDVRTWDREDHSVTIVPAEGAKACGNSIEKLDLTPGKFKTFNDYVKYFEDFDKVSLVPGSVKADLIPHQTAEVYKWTYQSIGFDPDQTIVVWTKDRLYRFTHICEDLTEDILEHFELRDQSDQDPSNTSVNTSEDEDYTTITPGEYIPQDRSQSEVLIQKNIDFVEVFNFRDGYNFKLDVRKYDVRTWNREDHSVTIVPIDKKKDCGASISRIPITTAKNIQDLIAFDPDYDPEPPTLNELTRLTDYPNIEAYLWIQEVLGYHDERILIWANDHYYRFTHICEDLTKDILEHFELRKDS